MRTQGPTNIRAGVGPVRGSDHSHCPSVGMDHNHCLHQMYCKLQEEGKIKRHPGTWRRRERWLIILFLCVLNLLQRNLNTVHTAAQADESHPGETTHCGFILWMGSKSGVECVWMRFGEYSFKWSNMNVFYCDRMNE